MRSMVEGATFVRRGDNRFHGCRYIAQDVDRGNAHNFDTAAGEECVAAFIAFRLAAHFMALPINLNRQARFGAEEVGDERPGRMLTAKFEAVRPQSKLLPKQHLRQAQAPAKLPGERDRRSRAGEHQPISPAAPDERSARPASASRPW
jgi:hypothetical protein